MLAPATRKVNGNTLRGSVCNGLDGRKRDSALCRRARDSGGFHVHRHSAPFASQAPLFRDGSDELRSREQTAATGSFDGPKFRVAIELLPRSLVEDTVRHYDIAENQGVR